MHENNVEELVGLIRSRYESLESPNFSFVKEAIVKRPYENVIRQTRKHFQLEEDTDPNDDVSFGYLLTREKKQWVLRISMVGPYAVLLRIGEDDTIKVVYHTTPMLYESEKELITILSDNGIRLLDSDTLCFSIPLKLFNAEPGNTRIYQALFTDSDILPWEGSTQQE